MSVFVFASKWVGPFDWNCDDGSFFRLACLKNLMSFSFF